MKQATAKELIASLWDSFIHKQWEFLSYGQENCITIGAALYDSTWSFKLAAGKPFSHICKSELFATVQRDQMGYVFKSVSQASNNKNQDLIHFKNKIFAALKLNQYKMQEGK